MDNNLKEIIQNMKYLSSSDKEVMSGIFENLQKQQKELFNEILKRNEEQMCARDNLSNAWKVITALINKNEVNEAKKSGLFELINISSFLAKLNFNDLEKISLNNVDNSLYSAGIAFLTCKYSDVMGYIKGKYKAHVFDKDSEYDVFYHFESYGEFKKQEEIIEHTARQYEIDIPIILSPMSRRAVHVIIDFAGKDISKAGNMAIDFRLQENGLADIVQSGKTLAWNIEIREKNEIPRPRENTYKTIIERLTPLFDEVYQVYEFPADENEYFYVETGIHDFKRYGNSIYLNMHESEKIENVRYSKIILHNVSDLYYNKLQSKFYNFFISNRIHKKRICTEGDIDYVMNMFKNDIAVFKGIYKNGNADSLAVRTYNSLDEYHYKKSKLLRSRSRIYTCYIRFERSENIYFEDYVNYIMAYLNYYYPEFYWVGVV